MSRGNWGTRIAIVGSGLAVLFIVWGLWLSTYSQGYQSGLHYAEAENYAAQYPADTDKRINNCPTGTVKGLKTCIEEAITASRDSERSERDLKAQRDMAEWAWWLLIVSVATFFLSGAGLAALVVTIRQGHAALDRTKEANDISRRALYAQEPLLHVEIATMDSTGLAKGMLIKNLGQTPAIVTAVCRKWDFGPIAPSRIIAGPKDKHSDEKPVTRDAIKADGEVLYASMLGDYPTSIGVDPCGFFYGYIRYITTFGFERTHEFCLYGDVRHPSGFDKRHQE